MNYEDLHLITRWSQVVQLRDNDLLTPAETILLDAAQAGETAQISRTVPNLKAPHVLIRAALLRYLILGGCKDFRTQPSGITVNGAWISGRLDLSFTDAHGPIDFFNCHFAQRHHGRRLLCDVCADWCANFTDQGGLSALHHERNFPLYDACHDGQTACIGGQSDITNDDA